MNFPAAPATLPPRSAFLQDARPIALYGAGTVGRDVLRLLTEEGFNVRYFLDAKSLPFTRIDGLPLLRPDDPSISPAERRATPVVVSIFNAYVSMPPIHSRLADLGWPSVTSFLELYQHYPQRLGDRFWLTDLRYYAGRESHYRAGAGVWADAKSRALYEAILQFRFTGDYTALPPPDEGQQYFPEDLPPWPSPLRFIDCGAFDGDTLRQIHSLGLPWEALAAFEPDPINFGKLSAALAELTADGAQTALAWPCGVWNQTTQLSFSAGKGSGSTITAAGDSVIQCVALDDVLQTFRPTLIKMDIEGAELAALNGARRIIQRDRPGLAVCLYHRPEHLWQIPLLLESWNLGYRFYLRCHCFNGFELVLYAVPEA